jgi:hypothetical protein
MLRDISVKGLSHSIRDLRFLDSYFFGMDLELSG